MKHPCTPMQSTLAITDRVHQLGRTKPRAESVPLARERSVKVSRGKTSSPPLPLPPPRRGQSVRPDINCEWFPIFDHIFRLAITTSLSVFPPFIGLTQTSPSLIETSHLCCSPRARRPTTRSVRSSCSTTWSPENGTGGSCCFLLLTFHRSKHSENLRQGENTSDVANNTALSKAISWGNKLNKGSAQLENSISARHIVFMYLPPCITLQSVTSNSFGHVLRPTLSHDLASLFLQVTCVCAILISACFSYHSPSYRDL